MTELNGTQRQKHFNEAIKICSKWEEQRETCLNKTEQKQFLEQTNVEKPHLTTRKNKTVQAARATSGSCGTDTTNNPSALLCEHGLMGKLGQYEV